MPFAGDSPGSDAVRYKRPGKSRTEDTLFVSEGELPSPRRVRNRAWLMFLTVLAAAVAHGARTMAHTKTTPVTWTVDVGPILDSRCVRCHRTGGFAPMSLATYGEAKTWAPAIREEVLSGRMPPWAAVPGFGDFANDASLSAIETELLTRWAEGGAPLGPAVPAPTPAAPLSDRAGALRLECPAVTVSGATVQTISLPTTLAGDRWIAGWEFYPGNRALVEEAVFSIQGAVIGSWTPFDTHIAYPGGMADRLPKGADVTVAIHYRKSAEPQTDRSALTLDLIPGPQREVKHRILRCGAHPIDQDVDVIAVTPRPAAAGDSMEIAASGPRIGVEPLSVLSRFRPEYAVTYRLRVPMRLRAGTRLDVRSSSDACVATLDYVTR
jgi:hypothetical protein